MRVTYDDEVDAVYIKLGNQKPDGVIEISEGVNLDTSSDNKIVGIEILNASKKMNIKTILSYELALSISLKGRPALEEAYNYLLSNKIAIPKIQIQTFHHFTGYRQIQKE